MDSMQQPVFIIAEAGVNHNGSYERAKALVDIAHQAGADAVKFQTFHADALVCRNAPKADYQKRTTSAVDPTQYQMLKQLELSDVEQTNLYHYCQSKSIIFMSSPFDLQSVTFLCQTLNLPQIKIASGEITNSPLLWAAAKTGKSIILSSGMCTIGEIEAALAMVACGYLAKPNAAFPSQSQCDAAYHSEEGQLCLREKVSLLHCTTEYPAPFSEVNLRVITTLQQAFGLRTGFSDHTPGIAIPIAAVACGALIIEKHFTTDKSLPGPDHQASLDPHELTAMVAGIRQVEVALGHSQKRPTASELKNRAIARKSLVALDKIAKGATFTEQNVGCKRTVGGLSPIHFWDICQQPADRDYEPDELIGV